MNPAGHHLINVLFHILNSLLLFMILMRMTNALWRSAFVATLFAIHPLHVESVAWLAERKDVLSTFFWMLTMWGYVRYVERPGVGKYLTVIAFYMLGLMAKPMLVTLPFVLLLLDYWPLKRFQFRQPVKWRLISEKVPLIVLSAASCVITFFVQQGAGAIESLSVHPLTFRTANVLISYAAYIKKTFWPYRLAILYPYPQAISWCHVAGACILLASVSLLAIRLIKKYPFFVTGWLWYMGSLVPVIGLVQVGSQAMADRYTYIPLIGFFIIIAWGVPELTARWQWHRRKTALVLISASLLSILAVTTLLQVRYWTNSITIFEHTLHVTANNHIMHNNLAFTYAKQGNMAKAAKHYTEALLIDPGYAKAHYYFGEVLATLGKSDEAVKHYYDAVLINPGYAEAHYKLGIALEIQGKLTEAIKHYSEALRINPEDAKGYLLLANAMDHLDKKSEAVRLYSQALRIDPKHAEVHNSLGGVLCDQGRTYEASRHFSEALRIKPKYVDAHNNLGAILVNQGQIDEAIKHFSEALRINPNLTDAHNNMGIALAKQNNLIKAISHFSKALKINPEGADTHNNLGLALAKQGMNTDAFFHFSEALRINPRFTDAYNNAGFILAKQGKLMEAIDHFSEALRINPEHADTHNNIGIALAEQGRIAKAINHFSEALRINPAFENAQANLDRALTIKENNSTSKPNRPAINSDENHRQDPGNIQVPNS